jgi:hypothetical protein
VTAPGNFPILDLRSFSPFGKTAKRGIGLSQTEGKRVMSLLERKKWVAIIGLGFVGVLRHLS